MQRIDHLKKDIHWLVADGYNRWLVKYLKKTHITTGKEAQNVIEAMKAMKARQNGIDQKNNAPRPPLTSRGGA